MTDYTSSYSGPSNGTSEPSGSAPATTDTAKEETSRLKDSATQAGGQLLQDAKGEAAAVTQEARRQLGDLWSQARDEVSGQATTQQTRLAGGLTSIGGQLTQMASNQSEQNVATDIVHEVGQRADSLGRWLESHGPDELVDEVRAFARRRPVAFLAIAAGAGIVLGRLTRGLKDAPPETRTTRQPTTTQYSTGTPVATSGYAVTGEQQPRSSDPLGSPVTSTGDQLGAPVTSTSGWDQR